MCSKGYRSQSNHEVLYPRGLTRLKKHGSNLIFFSRLSENSIKLRYKIEESDNPRKLRVFKLIFLIRTGLSYNATLSGGNYQKHIRVNETNLVPIPWAQGI